MKVTRKQATAKKNIPQRGDTQMINTLAQRVDALMKRIPKGTFRAVGGAAGGALGGPIGSKIGRRVGAGISDITGYGDYTVTSGLTSTPNDVDIPAFVSRNSNGITVAHREYVGTVTLPTTTGFSAESYVINPGNASLFPWLSALAANFQEYRFDGLVFTFQSRTSEYAADNAMGTVMMATNYNVQEYPFSNASNLLNTQFAVSAKPSKSFIHAIECDSHLASNPYKYVRDPNAQDPSVVSDPRFYDLGRTTLATEGIPGAPGYVVGVLYVSYKIELVTPILNPTSIAPTSTLYATNAVTSTLDGSSYDSSVDAPVNSARALFNCTSVTPATSTLYYTIPNLPVNTVGSFYTASLASCVQPTMVGGVPTMRITQPGRYTMRIVMDATTSGSAYALARASSVEPQATLIATGGMSVSADDMGCSVPHIPGLSATNEAKFTLSYVFTITGATGYVDFTPGSFTSHTGNLVTNLETAITVEWLRVKETQALEVTDVS